MVGSEGRTQTRGRDASPKAQAEVDPDGRRKRKRKARTEVQAELLAGDPELAARLTEYQAVLKLSEKDATTLTSDRNLSDFFEAARRHTDHIRAVANWTINAVQAHAKDTGFDDLSFTGAEVAALVDCIEDGRVSSKGAKKVFAIGSALPAPWGSFAMVRASWDHHGCKTGHKRKHKK